MIQINVFSPSGFLIKSSGLLFTLPQRLNNSKSNIEYFGVQKNANYLQRALTAFYHKPFMLSNINLQFLGISI
jgi:hypothetical protein